MSEIVILTQKEDYGRALLESLSGRREIDSKLSLYTDPYGLNPQEVLDVYYIAVIDENNLFWIDSCARENTLAITDIDLTDRGIKTVPKFSPLDDIVTELLFLMTSANNVREGIIKNIDFSGTSKTKVIGLFSPVRRSCQTTLGLTIGNILSEERKVLYLNFESFSGFWYLSDMDGRRTLTDLIMILETNPSFFNMYLNSLIYHSGKLDIIPPVKTPHQMLDIKNTQWINLISTLKNMNQYDVIILDLSESLHGLLEILTMCDRVYTLEGQDGYSEAKIAQYEEFLSQCECNEIAEKTVKKRIPYFTQISNGFLYKPFSAFSKYVRELIMGDNLYAGLCFD